MGRVFVSCGKKSSSGDIKKMLEAVSYARNDKMYLIGGITDKENREDLVSLLEEHKNITYIMDDTDIFCFYYLYCRSMKERKSGVPVYNTKLSTLSKMASVRSMLPALEWAKESPVIMKFYQGKAYEKIIYCGGFSFYISNGVRPVKDENADASSRKEDVPEDIALFEDAIKISDGTPDYRKYYYFRLKQGEIEEVITYDKRLSSDEAVKKDLRYMPVITASIPTGKMIKKGRDLMPVIDTGNVINIYTGGTCGKPIDEMKGVLSCMELVNGDIIKVE